MRSGAAAHGAKKRFGQHFLHDPQVIGRILRAINPQPDDTLVEIGPGLGALTVPLLQRVQRLHVVEIDRDVVPHLRAACGDAPGLELHLADALKFDFGSLAAPGRPLRLVGNLPYNISTPLLFRLLGYSGLVRDMHFMLQKEVVDRITAAPGSGDYGRLTVTLAARAAAEMLFEVGPGAFRPPPRVVSAVVRITPRPAPFALRDAAVYDRVVTAAFGQRRKTLANALRGLLPAAEIAAAGIDPGARAETLAPEQFARLAGRLPSGPGELVRE
ncbi:MAG: 16S rRNA (adenine(1518)-N(6)/adenine(1519)-N(6))-dimethyltransferase RsmA [Nevskia sp.]|nr:16S rRNA (adenine(1518)-N(6)/adenine(1519)-N(6))-dimethyltransferase RsmA [Nevskia sp.]